MSKKKINEEVLNWYANCSNKGISSETLANTASQGIESGCKPFSASPPSDNSDFGRCVLFKDMCPTAFSMAKKILKDKPIWNVYFKNWKRMTILLEEQRDKKNDGTELFNFMQDTQSLARKR